MKRITNQSKTRKVSKKKKLTYAQRKFRGNIKSTIGPFKGKIWPNQAVQEL